MTTHVIRPHTCKKVYTVVYVFILSVVGRVAA